MVSEMEYLYISIIPSFLSAICSGTFIFCYVRYEGLRLKPYMRMIATLQLFDLITSLNHLFPANLIPRKEAFCQIKGFIDQLFSTSEAIWISWFSLFIYRGICEEKDKNECININKALIITFSISFPIALTFGLLGFYNTSLECWTEVGNALTNFFIVYFIGSYIFVFISFGWGAYVMFCVQKKIRSKSGMVDKKIMRLQMYPILNFFCYFFQFINRAAEGAQYEVDEGYKYFAGILINLIGVVNFGVLGSNEEFWSGIRFKRGKTITNVNLSHLTGE